MIIFNHIYNKEQFGNLVFAWFKYNI